MVFPVPVTPPYLLSPPTSTPSPPSPPHALPPPRSGLTARLAAAPPPLAFALDRLWHLRRARVPAMQRTASTSGTDSMSVPLACVPCRERHVKCDGLQPCCSRCFDSKQSCFYVQSRRGRRPSRNKRQRSEDSTASAPNPRRRSSTLTRPDAAALELGPFGPRVQSPNLSPPSLHPASAMQASFPGTPRARSMSRSPVPMNPRVPQPSVVSPGSTPARLTELYYFYFHDAHPILIPQLFLPQIQPARMPRPVEAAMHYVGSQYSTYARDDPQYLQRLQALLFGPAAERSRFAVQALILLGIAQRAQDRNDLAYETFGQAMDLAVELRMNRAAFARENSEGSPVIEEMWRRVWWELYVNDALLAATREDDYFRMHAIESDVALPCEEIEYRSCNPGVARPFKDLQETAFYDEAEAFSSFTYRIAAARDVHMLLKLNRTEYPDHAEPVTSLDLALNNWFLHLPDDKKIPLDVEGRVDQMMYQAQLTANFTSICLHRPRSSLIFTSIQEATAWGAAPAPPPATSRQIVHTAKAIEAADRINSLVTLPGDSLKHSPLFAASVAMSALVHLSAYVLSTEPEQTSLIRDRISLGVGALKSVRWTWPLAAGVLDTLRAAAREVMTVGRALPSPRGANPAAAPPVLGSNPLEYDPRSLSTDNWMSALHDPLFSHIPELADPMVPVTLSAHISTTYAQ